MNRYYRIGWSLILILAFIIGLAAPVAAREPRHDRHDQGPQRQDQHAPARYVPVAVKDRQYFFLDGIFYRPGLNSYIAVQAPLGAIVLSLPIGAYDVAVGGSKYSVYGGVYYRHVPNGYEVVKKPYMGEAYCSTDDDYKDLKQVMVVPPILNVREGPGMNHPVVYKVYRNDVLKIIGEAPGWVYVSLPHGEFGWVMKEYVSPLEPAAKG